jgi:CBS domain containing-hemolysin-like protein
MTSDPFFIIPYVSALFLIIAGYFSACHHALSNIERGEVPLFDEERASRAERLLHRLMRYPRRLIVHLNFGFIFYSLLFAATTEYVVFHNWQGAFASFSWISAVALIVLALVLAIILVYGAVAIARVFFGTTAFVTNSVWLLWLLTAIQKPFVIAIEGAIYLVADRDKMLSYFGAESFEPYSKAEEAEEKLESEEKEMISAIYEFGETTVREIMTPRIDIEAIDAETPPAEIYRQIASSPYSRFPVFDGKIDNVIGILHIKDVIKFLKTHPVEALSVRELVRDAAFIPETKKLDELLRDLRATKVGIAVVVDEYGGTAGLVTLEDVLEEIVGEIQDEYDDEAKPILEQEDGSYMVTAKLPVDDLDELLGKELKNEDYDTVGGLVFHELGRVPEKGDSFTKTGLRFTVLGMEKNRIKRLRIEKLPSENDNGKDKR